MKRFVCILLTLVCTGNLASATSPVDRTSPLATVRTDFALADGPSWDGFSLYVPDVKGERLFRYFPTKEQWQTVLGDAGRISASFYNHGKLFLSDNGAAHIAFLAGKQKTRIAGQDPNATPPARPNDLVVDSRGGIYYTLTRQNQVIYIDPDGQQTVALDNVTTPNGITLSPDERTLYVAAYAPKEIWAYPIPTAGRPAAGKRFAVMDDGPAKGADGMTIDRAGNVYCAGATDVWIWNPSGKLLDKIACPTRPINCTFGDRDMRSLYITGFGGLYRQRMIVSGRSPHPPSAPGEPVKNKNQPSTAIPNDITAKLDIPYARYGDRQVLLDLFTQRQRSGPQPALVIVHGGGWKNGDKTKFRALAVALAQRGYVTAAIEYRLADEAAFPAGIHDCNAAVRYLRANAATYQIDPDRIGAVGGSAGGHLVGLMASGWQTPELQGTGGHADQSSQLQAAVVMAGPLQMTQGSVAERSRDPKADSNANRWLRKTIDQAPELYRLADAHLKISAKTPPILFLCGELDDPPRNQASRDKLKHLGIDTGIKIYPDAKHGCWNQLPWFRLVVDDAVSFFQTQFETN